MYHKPCTNLNGGDYMEIKNAGYYVVCRNEYEWPENIYKNFVLYVE